METSTRLRPRPEKRITRKVISYDLALQARRLKREKPWTDHGHDAITIFRRQNARAVLIVLKADSKIRQHETKASVILQLIEGRVCVHLNDEAIELGPNMLVSIESHVAYEIEARGKDVTLLLTFCPSDCLS